MCDLTTHKMNWIACEVSWSAWQLQPDPASATFRGDITPLELQVFRSNFPQRASRCHRPKEEGNVRLNNPGLMLWAVASTRAHSSTRTTGQRRSFWGRTPERLNGVLVATKNATRPAMVNLDGYQFGMTQFIKIPEEGETYELFAPAKQTHVSCIIRSSPELNLENLRGRWVIARLQRCNRHKRKLVLEFCPPILRTFRGCRM